MDSAPYVTVLEVDDVTCHRCSERLRAALVALPGVIAADVTWPTGHARVRHSSQITIEHVMQAIEAASVGTHHHYRVRRVTGAAHSAAIRGGNG